MYVEGVCVYVYCAIIIQGQQTFLDQFLCQFVHYAHHQLHITLQLLLTLHQETHRHTSAVMLTYMTTLTPERQVTHYNTITRNKPPQVGIIFEQKTQCSREVLLPTELLRQLSWLSPTTVVMCAIAISLTRKSSLVDVVLPLATIGGVQLEIAATFGLLGEGICGRFPYSILTCSHSSIMTSRTEEAMADCEGILFPAARGDSGNEVSWSGSSPDSEVICLKRVRNFSRLALSRFLHLCRGSERQKKRVANSS